jgi:hypothetical protein
VKKILWVKVNIHIYFYINVPAYIVTIISIVIIVIISIHAASRYMQQKFFFPVCPSTFLHPKEQWYSCSECHKLASHNKSTGTKTRHNIVEWNCAGNIWHFSDDRSNNSCLWGYFTDNYTGNMGTPTKFTKHKMWVSGNNYEMYDTERKIHEEWVMCKDQYFTTEKCRIGKIRK